MRLILPFVFLLNTISISIAQEVCVDHQKLASLKLSDRFATNPDSIGIINQKEISGIAPSVKYPGYFWAINDSGNGPVLYLYALKDASLKALFILNGISNIDWEDLSIEINENGAGILYIADIGDNKAKREVLTIYKIPEPDIQQDGSTINKLNVNPESIRFTYSNGARDAEALAVDPIDNKAYIITKREKQVYIYTLPSKASDSIQFIQPIGNLPMSQVVASDFSQDGSKFMLKTYTNIYLWDRTSPNEPFCEMISGEPKEVTYQLEPQGESLCFVGNDFITVSEERFEIKPRLYLYTSIQPSQD